jgi:DNA-binding beta-propeller fold protein YncE
MTERSDRLSPNRGEQYAVSRRRLLAGSATVGAASIAGCGSEQTATATETLSEAATVLTFNTGDRTVTVVDAANQEVVETTGVGATSSFPSNQYTPDLVDSGDEAFWGNVDDGVRAFGATDLVERARVETGTGRNWQERTPDGSALVVSAREPSHTQYKVDADPDSDSVGSVLGELDRTEEGGRGDTDGPGPCDVTIHPDGQYAYVPDLFGDTLTVLDVDTFEIVRQVAVDPLDGDAPKPWMATVSRDGETLLVEHRPGFETVWDVSDPAAPAEVMRFTEADGLGGGALTSEVTDDGSTGFVFTPETADVTVLDIVGGTVADRIDLGGSAYTGSWGPARERLFVPVRSADELAVIDPVAAEITARLETGSKPYGATAAQIRPTPTPAPTASALATLGLLSTGTTYCIGECACGHDGDQG